MLGPLIGERRTRRHRRVQGRAPRQRRRDRAPSSSPSLRPEYALISVGEGNRFGHPTPSTLAELAASRIARAAYRPVRRRDGAHRSRRALPHEAAPASDAARARAYRTKRDPDSWSRRAPVVRHWSRRSISARQAPPRPRSPMAKQLSEYKPVYLIYGDQDLLLERALEQLKRSVGELADLDFNSETFDGENANADEIVAACNTLPFASERRLVVVRNVDKMGKDGTEASRQVRREPGRDDDSCARRQEARQEHAAVQGRRQAGRPDRARCAHGPASTRAEVQKLFARKGQTRHAGGRRAHGQRRRQGPAPAVGRGGQGGRVHRRQDRSDRRRHRAGRIDRRDDVRVRAGGRARGSGLRACADGCSTGCWATGSRCTACMRSRCGRYAT